MKLNDALGEVEALTEQVEEEQAGKAAIQAKLSKANTEMVALKANANEGGGARVDELEAEKKKLLAKVADAEESVAAAESKAAALEKTKARMNEEVEDLLLDLEKVNLFYGGMLKLEFQ